MPNIIKKSLPPLLIIAVLSLGALILFSCGDLPEDSIKTVSSLSISPASASLEVGATQTFTARATYTDSTSSLISPTWSLSGEVGTLSTSGLFTATAEGSGTIAATYEGKSDTASVTVTVEAGSMLTTIEVSPGTMTLRVSETQILTATGQTITGEVSLINPVWSMSGDAIGTLTASGGAATLEVNAEGTATISCTTSEVTGCAYVTVEGFVVEITVEADTYVDEENPGSTHGSDTSLKAGYVNATAKQFQTYLKFSLSSLPGGASVESATLKAYATTAGSSSLQLKQLTNAFTNATTWETRPTIGTYLLAKTFTAGGYNSLNSSALNDLVAKWQTGAATNNGLAIVQEGTEDGTVVILSLDNGENPPLLRLEYTTP